MGMSGGRRGMRFDLLRRQITPLVVACATSAACSEQVDVMTRFFFTPEEEGALDFFMPKDPALTGMKRIAGFAQPLNNVTARAATASELGSWAQVGDMCLRWDRKHSDPSKWKCFDDRSAQYSWVRYSGYGQNQTFETCRDIHAAANRNWTAPFSPSPGCTLEFRTADEEDKEEKLIFEGPTLIVARSPHFPHWLEEISAALTWLAKNGEDAFRHVLIMGDEQACWSFPTYVTGSWAPNGSPLRETLQIQFLQTVAKGIVFSWGLRPNRDACFGSPWVSPLACRRSFSPSSPSWDECGHSTTWGHPLVAVRFRSRIMSLLHPDLSTSSHSKHAREYELLVIQRFSGGRKVTNLHELLTHEAISLLPIKEMKYVQMGVGDFKTVLQQSRAFLQAGVVVAHHGAVLALAPLLRPGSLVVELLNYRTYCDRFDLLFGNLGLAWRRLFYQHGNRYKGRRHDKNYNGCRGSGVKDARDNAPADLDAVATMLQQYMNGLMAEGHELLSTDFEGDSTCSIWSKEQNAFCCPTCQRCGYSWGDLRQTEPPAELRECYDSREAHERDQNASCEGSCPGEPTTEALANEGVGLEDWVRSKEEPAGGRLVADTQSVGEEAFAEAVSKEGGNDGDDDAYEVMHVKALLARMVGGADHEIWPELNRIGLLKKAFSANYSTGYESCDRAYQWWRSGPGSLQRTRVCLERLLALSPRWRCIGAGCAACLGQCQEVLAWEEGGAEGDDDGGQAPAPEFLERDLGYREAAHEAAEGLLAFQQRAQASELGLFPRGQSLFVVMSAQGPSFRRRREHSQTLLTGMEIAGVLSTSVTRQMLQEGGWLERCVSEPQADSSGLSVTFFASALNHLHTFLYAVRIGFSNLIVLEDDMVVRLKQGRPLELASHILLDTLHDAEAEDYDLVSFGDCAGIHPNISSDSIAHSYGSLVSTGYQESDVGRDPSLYRELWRVSKGSRCAGAYAVSRAGMFKALLHLPMWCSMDWMFNGAKKAAVRDALSTTVFFLEPALFEEGSKRGMFATTMTGCDYCDQP